MIATTRVSARPATDCGGTIGAVGRSFVLFVDWGVGAVARGFWIRRFAGFREPAGFPAEPAPGDVF
ncbi:MAG: hypothetical protein JJ902_17810 [Roseibium sp.]|nr:hypothetical protein [Roseibium sp.]